MSLILIDRFHPRQRSNIQAQIDNNQLTKVDELALLEPDQLRPLALLSLNMLITSSLFFVLLDLIAYHWHYQILLPQFTFWSVLLWIFINILSYIIILPIHELIHGIVIAGWGGRPHFGAKLPLALYCGARNQLFPRNYYLAVGLAPLVVISLAGVFFTLLAPSLAAYVLLALAGNFSGAAGDLLAVQRLRTLSPQTYIEDTETGYTAWTLSSHETEAL